MQFRKDINALRAVAVLLVVIFHFQPTWLPGGFIGVDIFFVISGFLMTSIIMRDLEENTFKLSTFYSARVRRIVPALLFLCLVILILGYFFLLPNSFEIVGRHVRDSVTFISNLTYEKEAGYFDLESKTKWLLHTWSLSVEWQFYLLYPLLLIVIMKTKLRAFRNFILIAITIASFVWCTYLGKQDPNAVYYQLASRGWELSIGSIAYLYAFGKGNKYLGYIGWSVIFFSLVLIDESLIWPSYYTLLPVFGVLMIIIASCSGHISKNILVQKLGTYSYSIYLWHWPILVSLNYLGLLSLKWTLFGIVFSLLLGMFSYHLIENLGKSKHRFVLPIIAIITIIIYSYSAYIRKDGAPERPTLSVEVRTMYSNIKGTPKEECSKKQPSEACRLFSDNPTWAVFGDSHSYEMAYSLGKALQSIDDGVIQLSRSGCPLLLNPENRLYKESCANWRKSSIEWLVNNHSVKNVLLINRYNFSLFGKNETDYPNLTDYYNSKHREQIIDDLKANIQRLTDAGKTVWLISSIPEMGKDIYQMIGENHFKDTPLDNIIANKREYNDQRNSYINPILSSISAENRNVYFIDITDVFCDSNFCYASRNNLPLYRDDDHPSLIATDIISQMVIKLIK